MIKINKRGPVTGISGLISIAVSLSIMIFVLPFATVTDRGDFYLPSMFEGMFNQISDDIEILPGNSGYFSYSPKTSDVPLLWGVQVIDYKDGDKFSVIVSDIYGGDYGIFSQGGPMVFKMLKMSSFDTLNFEIQNQGSRTISVVVMLSEDPDNSDALSNPNSRTLNMILSLVISGILLIVGIIVFLIGVILSLIDWKNIQNNKRNH